MEQSLGVLLLQRGNRRFTLTPAGTYFYQRGKILLEEAEALCRETARLGEVPASQLRIGYLRCYSGLELRQAVAEFTLRHPQVTLHAAAGTHEELYDLLRTGQADLVLTDQRRAFSDAYCNYPLLQCGCTAELSVQNPLSARERVTLEALKQTPCILVSSREQQAVEDAYFRDTLGFRSSFLFADTLEEARLLVAGNRGFLPVAEAGTLPPAEPMVRRVPIYRDGRPLRQRYCLFWPRDQASPYAEVFAELFRSLLPRP